MFKTTAVCEVCGKELVGQDCLPVVQSMCTDCGAQFNACPRCRRGGCPSCGGKVIEVWKFRINLEPSETLLLKSAIDVRRGRD
ncbi:MAG: hypothetical protein QFX35_03490 [Candidatus Verstraetearchaeota archaeon]|nr:hypothetical protein [Candidatus Verstraetearchaeota archaeon]